MCVKEGEKRRERERMKEWEKEGNSKRRREIERVKEGERE